MNSTLTGMLESIHLQTVAQVYSKLAIDAEKNSKSYTEYLQELVTMEIEERRNHTITKLLRQAKLPRNKLLKEFVYTSRQKAAMAESYMKNIVVEIKMTQEYKNKKECMFGTYEDLDRFIEIISEHNLNGNKEPEEEKHNNNNIEMYKIQTDKEIEIKRMESEMEIQKNKQTSIMSLFERKLITFEQFNESFQKI